MKRDRRVLAVTGAVVAVAAAIGILASGGSEHARPVRRPAPAPVPRGRPEVAKSVPMRAGAPTGVAYGHGRVWVTRSDGTVVRLKPRTGRLVDKTRVGRFPVRIAIDRDAAWVVDDETGMLSELDLRDAHVLRRTRVCDTASGVASTGDTVWVVCALGQLVGVDAASGRVISRTQPAPVAVDPADLAATPSSVWVTGLDRLVRVDPATAQVTATVAVPQPADVAVGAGAVWVANFDSGTVTRIDPDRAVVTGRFRVGRNPSGVALAAGEVWVLNNGDSTVSKLDARSGRLLATIRVGSHSYDIAAGGGAVWAQSFGAHSLFRIHRRRHAQPELL